MKVAADILSMMGMAPVINETVLEVPIPGSKINRVVAAPTMEDGKVKWVTVRIHGAQTRTCFPTLDPCGLAKAVARNVLLAMLDVATDLVADEILLQMIEKR